MTGGTGFVGKVLLFKILSEVPDIKSVYLLCRGKKPRRSNKFLQPQERLQEEVLGSPCFDPLRKRLGKAKWAELSSRVKAVNGDITQDGLGLSAADTEKLTNEVQLIVHLAATVNFNERLNAAVQMNTLGGLRVLALAKKCKNIEAMVHVSTCYVNFQRQGRDNPNMEEIYPLEFDAEAMVKHILAMHDAEIPQESKRILSQYNFPNTYTFTKNMGEQLIMKYKENVPVVIVRPSIIGASLHDPFPGWVDALTAAGGILLTACLGVVRELNLGAHLLADIIPVDFVVNVIMKALFCKQQERLSPTGSKVPLVFQVATTSSLNALSWARFYVATKTIMNSTPKKHPKAISRCQVYLTTSPTVYRLRYTVLRYFPYLVLHAISTLPEPIGTEKRRKLVNQLGRAVRRADMMNAEFHDFVIREWVYDIKNAQSLDQGLSEKTKKAFQFDPLDIDWFAYIQNYIYGMMKFIVKDVGELSQPPAPRSALEMFKRASL